MTKTLTLAGTKAFARHQKLAKQLQADTYFTRSYISQDKDTIENRIGLIRWFLPKGTDLCKVTNQHIKTIEKYLNFRPIREFDHINPVQQSLTQCAFALTT